MNTKFETNTNNTRNLIYLPKVYTRYGINVFKELKPKENKYIKKKKKSRQRQNQYNICVGLLPESVPINQRFRSVVITNLKLFIFSHFFMLSEILAVTENLHF